MPRDKQKIRVIKVPLKMAPLDQPQVFPRLPRLYLELMENKSKIHQDLVNKEYAPIKTVGGSTIEREDSKREDSKREDSKSEDSKREDSKREDSKSEDSKSEDSKREDSKREDSKREDETFKDRLNTLLSDDSNSNDSYDSPYSSPGSIASSISDLSIEEDTPIEDDDGNDSDDSNLSRRLKNILGDNVSESSVSPSPSSSESSNKYSRHRGKKGHSVNISPGISHGISHGISPGISPGAAPVPSLAELESKGGYVPRAEMRDIGRVNNHEQEDAKREILFKFDLLRKSYPVSSIPDFTIHTDLNTMEKAYGDCVRRLSLDSSVENYKTYLVYGFMGVEFILGNFLGFEMHGFTQQQIVSMHSYEKLLIELGEKSYVPSGSSWPVEIRLLFMIIMNAAFFVISKMMMKKTGANLMGMINSMNRPTAAAPSVRKRKMKGPSIDISDIPNN